jgi:hypothetical protein
MHYALAWVMHIKQFNAMAGAVVAKKSNKLGATSVCGFGSAWLR